MEWFGYRGKILNVDLSSGKIEAEELDRDAVRRFLGGSGLNAWLLYKHLPHNASPLDPESPLIFGAGPLVGTEFPCSARSTFTALSPLTGIFGDANGGGYFAAMVKLAGYDHIVLRGAAESPCYLYIDRSGTCTLEKADGIWGLDVFDTDSTLAKKHSGSMVACIGPAGENTVPFANILTHDGGNSWSRTGVGAVMGSKKLKAIVANGRGKIPIAKPEDFSRFCDELSRFCTSNPHVKGFSQSGTMRNCEVFSSRGFLYHHNYRFQADMKYCGKLDIESFNNATESKSKGCYRCPIKCEKDYTLKDGPFKGEHGSKYEVGYACASGYSLGIEDVNSVLHITNHCNGLGMDLFEATTSICTAIDLFQEGILTAADTDGMTLEWNNVEMVDTLLEKTAKREGFGALLAQGSRAMEKAIGKGTEKFTVHIKGMTDPAPSCPPFILSLAVGTRGGDHQKGFPTLLADAPAKELTEALYGGTDGGFDLNSHEDKGRVIWWHENYKMIGDSMGSCFFLNTLGLANSRLEPAKFASAYSFATGMDCDGAELFIKGERAYQLERAFNALHGVTRTDDTFKASREKDGWGHGVDLNHPGMLDEYYQYRGCSKDGLPLRRRLEEAGLKDIADALEQEGKLGKEETDTYITLEKLAAPNSKELTIPEAEAGEPCGKSC
ncbi:MAG: aldehyde ferredoxin oxidoreductase family protein [Vulcanimicrobiota bacterium]